MTVTWFNRVVRNPKPATDEQVEEAERQLEVRLPADFLAIARAHQGARPEPNLFDLPDGSGGHGVINYLLHFEEEPFDSNIVQRGWPAWHHGALPEKVIPFAEDSGNLICFDYRNTDEAPEVVYWDHESDAPLQRVASNFTELIGMLHDIDDEGNCIWK